MSRTYRRKHGYTRDLESYVSEWIYPWRDEGSWVFQRVCFPSDSHEYSKGKSKYHSDAGTHNFKEPGPSWFRNLFTERPLRRFNRRELQKWMLDPDYEPMVMEKGKLEYWT